MTGQIKKITLGLIVGNRNFSDSLISERRERCFSTLLAKVTVRERNVSFV